MTHFLDSFDEDETFDGVTDFLVQEDFLLLDSEVLGDQVGQDSSFLDLKLLQIKNLKFLRKGSKILKMALLF